MKSKINYNGSSKKGSFYKLKKHFKILSTRAKTNSEIKKIRSFNNSTLNGILDAFLTVKNGEFDKVDLEVIDRQEKYRAQLLNDETIVTYEIFNSDSTRKVKDVCRISASPKTWAQLLYILTKKLGAKQFLEIGTNVGISGAYIMEGLKEKKDSLFVTMEGLSQLCEISERQFLSINAQNSFEIISGLYDDTFLKVLQANRKYDILFIDGNHQKEPTIEYFNKLKKHSSDPVVFIIDDINYSLGMNEAWEVIKNDDMVNYSIDLFKNGIVILDSKDSNRNVDFALHLEY